MSEEINPFQSPQTVETGSFAPVDTTAGRRRGVIPFESGHTRAMTAIVALAMVMLVDALSIGSSLMQAEMLGRAFTQTEAEANDLREGMTGLCQLAVSLFSAVVFLMWMHRAYRNLPALDPDGTTRLKFTPGWAVGYWFIPIMNLFRPCQVMGEIWRGSDPARLERNRFRSPATLVGWWWAFHLGMGFCGNISAQLTLRAQDVPSLTTATWANILCASLTLPAGILAILLVKTVDQHQESRILNIEHPEPVPQ